MTRVINYVTGVLQSLRFIFPKNRKGDRRDIIKHTQAVLKGGYRSKSTTGD